MHFLRLAGEAAAGGMDRQSSGEDNSTPTSKKNKKKQNKGGYVKKEVSQEDIQKEIRDTLARLSGGKKSKSSKLRREKRKNIRERNEEKRVS